MPAVLHISKPVVSLLFLEEQVLPDTTTPDDTICRVQKETVLKLKALVICTAVSLLIPAFVTKDAAASHLDAKKELLSHVAKITADRARLAEVSIDLQNAESIARELKTRLEPLSQDLKKEQEASADMAISLYVMGDEHVASGLLAASQDPLALVSNMVMLEPVGLSRNERTSGLTSTSDALSLKLEEMSSLIPLLSKERDYLVASEKNNSSKLDKLAARTVRQPGDVALLGNPKVTPEILATYAENVSPKWILPVSRLQLATWYIEEGRAESVRGDIAFMQAARETGWFKFEGSMVSVSQNNFAGIGACDSCKNGESFPSIQEGVRAHIQMIRAYSDEGYSSRTTARPPIGRIDTNPVRGCCATWYELGRYWASAKDYGKRVVRMFNAVTYTARQEGWL